MSHQPPDRQPDQPTDPLAAMRRAGFDVGELVGSGMEGQVAALGDDLVVKRWDRRTRADVEGLRTFYDAVHDAGLPLAVPRILDVVESEGVVLTTHPRLTGTPPAPDDVEVVLEVLAALAAVPVSPGMAVLPVPDGERPFDPAVPFADSLADLVVRRARLLGDHVTGAEVAALVAALRGIPPVPPALLHGDLVPGNVLLTDGRPSALLDFGYVSTVGDPAFDAAVAAALLDMFGPDAAATTARIDALTTARLGHPPERLAVYRAAYGLVTASCLVDAADGAHLAWCLDLVRAARLS